MAKSQKSVGGSEEVSNANVLEGQYGKPKVLSSNILFCPQPKNVQFSHRGVKNPEINIIQTDYQMTTNDQSANRCSSEGHGTVQLCLLCTVNMNSQVGKHCKVRLLVVIMRRRTSGVVSAGKITPGA